MERKERRKSQMVGREGDSKKEGKRVSQQMPGRKGDTASRKAGKGEGHRW